MRQPFFLSRFDRTVLSAPNSPTPTIGPEGAEQTSAGPFRAQQLNILFLFRRLAPAAIHIAPLRGEVKVEIGRVGSAHHFDLAAAGSLKGNNINRRERLPTGGGQAHRQSEVIPTGPPE